MCLCVCGFGKMVAVRGDRKRKVKEEEQRRNTDHYPAPDPPAEVLYPPPPFPAVEAQDHDYFSSYVITPKTYSEADHLNMMKLDNKLMAYPSHNESPPPYFHHAIK